MPEVLCIKMACSGGVCVIAPKTQQECPPCLIVYLMFSNIGKYEQIATKRKGKIILLDKDTDCYVFSREVQIGIQHKVQ